jgi:chitinase
VSRRILTLLVMLALAGGATASGADFTATSHSTATFAAAADFNTVAVSLADPGATLTGTVSLSATASSDRGIASVLIQAAPAGTTEWVSVCTDNSFPYSCSWNTTTMADASYDLRATATDTAGYSKTATVSNRNVDNYALSVTLTDPGPMSGSESLTATAANASGGLQSLTIQHRAPGATSWIDVCTGSTTPGTCNLDTTTLPNGERELRAVARDNSNHVAQTVAITRTVDNTPPTATPDIPPSGSGTVTMTATAQDDGSGIAYVAFEALYMGTWYEFCRDTSAPFTCSGDSAAVADGTYSIRIVVENGAGVKTIGTPYSIVIDNTAPTGTDVQAGNGSATTGRLGTGDWIRLTWSEPIAPATALTGWNGSSQAIRVKIKNNSPGADTMDFYESTGATRLNLVSTAADLSLGGNYVSSDTEYNATMAQSGNSITITLGSQLSGSTATVASGTMTWRPSAGAMDAANHPSSTALVTESGALDADF